MTPEAAQLEGRRILVVEDDYLVAQFLVGLLEDAGAQVAGPIGWIDEAVKFLENDAQKLDGALLDVDLHGSRSYPVADMLIARAVPVVFVTGYGSAVMDRKYAQYPRCEKPLNEGAIIAVLAGA